MKSTIKWVDNVQFVAETGSGHALVIDGGLMAGRMWRRQPPFIREFHPARV